MILFFAKDGIKELLLFSFLFILCGILLWHFFPYGIPIPGILLLITLYFFRDPRRTVNSNQTAFSSPADGVIAEITELDNDEFIGEKTLRIGIFMSVFNVHINRIPFNCKVIDKKHFPGKYLNALNPKSAKENENNILFLSDITGNIKFKVRQIAGIIAQRIVCNPNPGETLSKGHKFGMIKFGSRTELYLPKKYVDKICVQNGDKVFAGITPLIEIKELA